MSMNVAWISLRAAFARAVRVSCCTLAAAALTGACAVQEPRLPDAGADSGGGVLLDAAVDAGFTDGGMPRSDYGASGPDPVGNVRVSMTDRTGARVLPVELWYPAAESARAASEAGQSMGEFERGTPAEAGLAAALASAPACVRARTRSAAAPAASTRRASMPAVVFSHCHGCTRFDVAEVAERLASHGILVAAPDHLGDTLWDATLAAIAPEFLAVRASDLSSVLDRLLDPTAPEVPADLRGRIDAARIGAMGHSFGGVTTGAVVASDARFVSALSVAAPISALGTLRAADVRVPYLFLVASEDNSIGSAGNRLMRRDHAALGASSWLVEVQDAGHWSFSDIAGLDPALQAGCGAGTRQEAPHAPFTYVDNATARALASDVAAAFFALTLLDDPGAANLLSALPLPASVSMHP